MKTVIEMAREAGIITNSPYLMPHDHVLKGIERFAELVRADEREACAKVCHDASVPLPGELQSDAQWSALCLATAIRARGQA